MTGFDIPLPAPCAWCGKDVPATGTHRRSRRFGPFHVDCPCPEQIFDGKCAECNTVMSLDRVLLRGLVVFVMSRHWVETSFQMAISSVERDLYDRGRYPFGPHGMFRDGLAFEIIRRGWGGSYPMEINDILCQKNLCPGSHAPPVEIRRPTTEGFGLPFPSASYLPWDERRYA